MLDQVFQIKGIDQIISTYRNTLEQLQEVEIGLKKRFVGLDDAVDALILAAASGETLLLVGPPGTAKSRLVSEFYKYVRNDDGGYFRYLLTRFTEPNELFGFFKITTNDKNEQDLRRVKTGMIQEATVVFLDEVFNASSAILNSLLTFIAEREFYDRGEKEAVRMQCLFGATNEIPYENELQAIFDRFTLRWQVRNVSVDPKRAGQVSLDDLLEAGWVESYGRFDERDENDAKRYSVFLPEGGRVDSYSSLLRDLRKMQLAIKKLTAAGSIVPRKNTDFHNKLKAIIWNCRQYDYSRMSNRRIIKMLYIMFIHSIYQAVKTGKPAQMGDEQLALLRFAVDRWDDHLNEFMPGTVYESDEFN